MNPYSIAASRFPPLPPSAQTPEQRVIYDSFLDMCEKGWGDKFVWKAQDGSLLGPFNMLLYTPTIAVQWLNLNKVILPLLDLREREIAILAVLATSQNPYGLYAHTNISVSAPINFTLHQVKEMKEGRCPHDLEEREKVMYRFARECTSSRGIVKEGAWNEAVAVLGREKIEGVVHMIGAWAYSGILLNTAGMMAPEGGEY